MDIKSLWESTRSPKSYVLGLEAQNQHGSFGTFMYTKTANKNYEPRTGDLGLRTSDIGPVVMNAHSFPQKKSENKSESPRIEDLGPRTSDLGPVAMEISS